LKTANWVIEMSRTQKAIATHCISVIFFLAVWYALSSILPGAFLPPPHSIVRSMYKIIVSGHFFKDMGLTLFRVIIGFGVAGAISTVIGVLMGIYFFFEKLFELEILVGLTIPGLIWVIIGILIFGLSENVSIFSVSVVLIPTFTINIWEGMKSLDPKLIEMARVYKSSQWMIIQSIVIPQLVPYIFAAVRFGLGVAWKVVVIAELFALGNGIGHQISNNFELMNLGGVISWAVLFCFTMLGIEYGIVRPVEKRVTKWRMKGAF